MIAHEYTHNLIYKNNKVIEKRPTRESVPLENISLDTLWYITPYGSVSAEEDMCEIAGVLFNGWSVSAEYQKELGKKFSLAKFHDEILNQGCLPLSVLERKMELWAKKQ